MQRTLQPTFSNRALAYCSHSLLKQITKGERYHFEKVYGIFIMNFHLVDVEPRLIRRISLIDEDTHEIFSDRMHMIFFDLKMMKNKSLAECEKDIERRLFLLKNMEKMEEKDKDFPMYDNLFDAADMVHLSNEEVVSYGASRMKLEDDREGLLYYGEQQLRKGIEQGEMNMLKTIVGKLKVSGMSLKQVIATLDFPQSEIEMLWD
ncbi:MAG: Rpn family recombination-promoting nuclease/putative transposase [Muribaculaceae bacterium]|nr:Rpn family recombination-promoting nuclease/putative transposase [Muribaculaceae bacterium]